MRQFDDAPSLVVTTPSLRGLRIGLGGSRTTVGRNDECDGILDDPTVSRRHAVIEIFGGAMTLRDLGSRNGTSVNGHPVVGSVRLHPGDVVAFGSIEARVEMPWARGPGAGSYADGPPAGSYAAGPPAGSYTGGPHADRADFHVGNQSAEQIHMAGRDYINVRAERESFLADIAATKTRGRRLVLIGFLCVIVGFALFGYGVVSFIVGIPQIDMNSTQPQVPSPFGPDVLGVPLGVIGFALFGLGSVIVIAGIVLHVSAAARLRRLQTTAGPTPERPGLPW